MKICSSSTWHHDKKCKIYVPLELFKWIYCRSCLWGAAIQECSLKIIVVRSTHWDVFINNAVLKLWLNFLKNTRDGVQFLVNLHVMLSCFWPEECRRVMFHHIILLNNYFCGTPLESCFCVLKRWERY